MNARSVRIEGVFESAWRRILDTLSRCKVLAVRIDLTSGDTRYSLREIVVVSRKLIRVFNLPAYFLGRENEVITMEMLGRGRRMYFRDKLNRYETARRTGLSGNAVKRWLTTTSSSV
jgi:hypothetical protein